MSLILLPLVDRNYIWVQIFKFKLSLCQIVSNFRRELEYFFYFYFLVGLFPIMIFYYYFNEKVKLQIELNRKKFFPPSLWLYLVAKQNSI